MTRRQLNEIFNSSFDDLYYLSLSYVEDSQIAEDVVQRAFIKAWEQRSNINNPISFIKKTVVNISLNEIRSKNSRENTEKIFVDWERVQEMDIDIFCERSRKVSEGLSKLPQDIRETVILKCFEDLKYQEIAKELGLSVDGVKYRIKAGYKKLREEIILLFLNFSKKMSTQN